MAKLFKYLVFVSVSLTVASIPLCGQIWVNNESIYDEAEGYMEGEDFQEAITLYNTLENKGKSNANIAYKQGICYLNIEGKESAAIPYLEKASKHVSKSYKGLYTDTTAPLEALMNLGLAYRLENRFSEAVNVLSIYKDSVSSVESEQLADYYIRQINTAKILIESPSGNSLHPITDKSPYILSNPVAVSDSLFFYMESKPFYNAVMSGFLSDNVLEEKENLTPKIGVDDNIRLVSISPNGKRLMFTAYVAGKGYELFYSDFANKWKSYKAFPEPINSASNESFVSVTANGKRLFFSSNRNGGYGGNDIYTSELSEDGIWQTPQNLGANINTPFNEEVCYVSADGKTLYLSSEGHLNMGGYDLFVSEYDSVKGWRDPVNLGSPISTCNNDDFISVSPQGKLYTSRLGTGEAGKYSLYEINILEKTQKKVLVKTQLSFNDEVKPKEVPYIIKSTQNDSVIIRSQTLNNGTSENLLSEGEYEYKFVYNDKVSARQGIVISKDPISDKLTLQSPDWIINPTKVEKRVINIKDILFDFDSYIVNQSFYPMLDSIADLLISDSSITVVVKGHTDALGSKEYNKLLSIKRAKSVSKYLINKGVYESRVSQKGVGEEEPVAIEKNSDGSDNSQGRKYNRRVSVTLQIVNDKIVVRKESSIPSDLTY